MLLYRNPLLVGIGLYKTAFERLAQNRFAQLERTSLEIDEVDSMRDHVARMAAAETLAGCFVVLRDESANQLFGELQALRFTVGPKNFDKLFLCRASQQHLILHPPPKPFFPHFLWLY